MAALRFPTITVELDTGERVEVRTTGGDARLYEQTAARHGWPALSSNVTTYLLFLTYTALRRLGRKPAESFDDWTDRVVAIEHDLDDEQASGVDPTPPVHS